MISSESVQSDLNLALETDPVALEFLVRLPRAVLIVEPFHGLGNRLRAYGSAAALAEVSDRQLIVVWITDPHVNSPMSALFDTSNISVIDFPVSHLLARVWDDVKKYDYNAEGRKDEIVQDQSLSPIYVRSAYVLQSQTKVGEPAISSQLNSLTPSRKVTKQFDRLSSLLVEKENLVGVHIRMVTDIKLDVPGIERYPSNNPAGSGRMGPVERERSRCHYTAFIPHLEENIRKNSRTQFFVASDSSEAIHALRQLYPERIISNNAVECEGESKRKTSCLQSSLAEFLVLSRKTSALILSDWSSASELIVRLSRDKVPHEIGCSLSSENWLSCCWKRVRSVLSRDLLKQRVSPSNKKWTHMKRVRNVSSRDPLI